MRSVLLFAFGVVIALLGLIVLSLVVGGCTAGNGDETVPASSPEATSTAAGPVGPDTQPAPTNAPPNDTPDAPTATPDPTDTPSEAGGPGVHDRDAAPQGRDSCDPGPRLCVSVRGQRADEGRRACAWACPFDGESRAYSVNLLSRHEIVNDVVGGHAHRGHVVTALLLGHSLCPPVRR